jgi:DNA-binding PadR family transcriptional regulator
MEDKYINREEKKVLEAGKPMYLYYLTPMGKEVLTHLREMLT